MPPGGQPHGGVPRKALRGGILKSFFQRPCQFLVINAHKMAPRTNQRLQERTWNAPTKGLARDLWKRAGIRASSDLLLVLGATQMKGIITHPDPDHGPRPTPSPRPNQFDEVCGLSRVKCVQPGFDNNFSVNHFPTGEVSMGFPTKTLIETRSRMCEARSRRAGKDCMLRG